MKKLMFTAAVAAAGGLMAIESANTVGYNNKVTDGTKYPIIGASFLPVSGASTFKLGDFIPTGAEAGQRSTSEEELRRAVHVRHLLGDAKHLDASVGPSFIAGSAGFADGGEEFGLFSIAAFDDFDERSVC